MQQWTRDNFAVTGQRDPGGGGGGGCITAYILPRLRKNLRKLRCKGQFIGKTLERSSRIKIGKNVEKLLRMVMAVGDLNRLYTVN